jgi:hypothetical protein
MEVKSVASLGNELSRLLLCGVTLTYHRCDVTVVCGTAATQGVTRINWNVVWIQEEISI